MSEVDLECSIPRRKKPNALTPEHLCDEHFSAFPADGVILAHRGHNVTLVVPNLGKIMGEVPDDGFVQRDRGLYEKRLMRTLFIETVLEGCEPFALFSQALAGADAVCSFNVRCSLSCLPF